MRSLGINVGSSSIKLALLEDNKLIWSMVLPHDGDLPGAFKAALREGNIEEGIMSLVTGTEGRYLFNINSAVEMLCLEEALKVSGEQVDAVVSMGGEDLVVYTVNKCGRIQNNFSGSKCASGTGEFFKQQLGRMDMKLDVVNSISPEARALPLSARCSVFMKSDCTHKLNKREAAKDDIVLSLSNVMAAKVNDFLNRAHITSGRVLVTGGVTLNKHIIGFIKQSAPNIEFIVPETASFYEAFGAAYLAAKNGSALPTEDDLFKQNEVKFARYKSLETQLDRVKYFKLTEQRVKAGHEYILGVDGGSTTTKACLIDIETNDVVASFYGRTHGDPIKALKHCLGEIKKKIIKDIGSMDIKISLAATTGSSREILGVFLETSGVYNEIIAHTYGTTYFTDDVDTIFEIGGQDAKYVLLKNKVPIDYAMNEACSAGTGSFLEESAQGDLNISAAWEIGEIALRAENPLKFGEHCSAFINSDIRKAIQQGATREDITAGIVTSIVSNYLNRVVGNRTVGQKIFLQGGVAKNKAVPLAFAMLLNKDIMVPPSPELMGCFGVGVLASEKHKDGFLEKSNFDIDKILETEIIYESNFICKACENFCPIQNLNVNNQKYMFGGRCSMYTNSRKKIQADSGVIDYVQKRTDLLFRVCTPAEEEFTAKRSYTIGIPKAFSVHNLYPFYSWFFHTLGIKTVLSDTVAKEGISRTESDYCFPAEIAHGAVQDIINKGCDFIFVPHFRDMPSYETSVHANFCPIIQSLPYYIKKAFPEVEDKILELVVSFKFGKKKALKLFYKLGERLNIPDYEIKEAFEAAVIKQEAYLRKLKELGLEALEEARQSKKPVIALMGRPYNAFTREANMGIPKKFTSRNYSIIPFDILPFENEEIFSNMYWYYGQQNMKTANLVRNEKNLYITFVTNFSCAPDSFMLHYLRWIQGTKPFLVLELDSHSADAGIDTRVEAFLDIIEGYKTKLKDEDETRYDNGLRFVGNSGTERLHVLNVKSGQKIPIDNNPKVKTLLANMGDVSTKIVSAILQSNGMSAIPMPVASATTLHYARNYASGKECLPFQLVLGSALQFLASPEYRKDEIYLLFVPITTGPCRTGQYFVFYENLFKDLKIDNVVVFTLSADNSYGGLGTSFTKNFWKALVVGDYLKDVQTSLRTCAENPAEALEIYYSLQNKMLEEISTDMKKLMPYLKVMAKEIAKIPLKKTVDKVPRVLIVGEIYVRRDDFAVDEIIKHLSSKGIIGKVSGIAEWIHYTDFVKNYDMKKRFRLVPRWKRLFSKEFRTLIVFKLEEMWKYSVEKKAKKALKRTKLVPPHPDDMNKIMKKTTDHFLNLELNSEIAVSSGSAATAMEESYSGVINISPFACLIGRVIEGIYTPWARRQNYPTMSVEVDGNVLPPNIINKLNIFMLNVLRFRDNPDMEALIEADGNEGIDLLKRDKSKELELVDSVN
ncbi:MAG: acyl-CoA dehydratase activase [Spirochaetes bacterium]|nr:acyl-CoA dehydratase activase [Spirochaetota bacterium]